MRLLRAHQQQPLREIVPLSVVVARTAQRAAAAREPQQHQSPRRNLLAPKLGINIGSCILSDTDVWTRAIANARGGLSGREAQALRAAAARWNDFFAAHPGADATDAIAFVTTGDAAVAQAIAQFKRKRDASVMRARAADAEAARASAVPVLGARKFKTLRVVEQ